jgi:hypothetical protein
MGNPPLGFENSKTIRELLGAPSKAGTAYYAVRKSGSGPRPMLAVELA